MGGEKKHSDLYMVLHMHVPFFGSMYILVKSSHCSLDVDTTPEALGWRIKGCGSFIHLLPLFSALQF